MSPPRVLRPSRSTSTGEIVLEMHGLRAGGHGRSNDGPPWRTSWRLQLPSSTAAGVVKFARGGGVEGGICCCRPSIRRSRMPWVL